MIKIRRDEQSLRDSINQSSPSWLARASVLNERARLSGELSGTGIWSEVKAILLERQHGKCAFCETLVASGAGVLREYDVEHYRPKNRVQSWPDAKAVARGVAGIYDRGRAAGYPELSHALDNYLVSCKICNQEFKCDFFPIAGAVASVPDSAVYSRSDFDQVEQPLLYFLTDEDPAMELDFRGLAPMPAQTATNVPRLQVNLDLFGLAYLKRESLFRERANALYKAFNEFITTDDGVDNPLLNRMLLDSQPHAACVRAFLRLCSRDIETAKRIYSQVRSYLASTEGKAFIAAMESVVVL